MRWRSYLLMAALACLSGGVGSILTARLLGAGGASAQPTDIAGSRFVLLDERGAQRGVLEVMSNGGARLAVTGPNTQTPRATLAVDPTEGPRVLLLDQEGAVRLAGEVRTDGGVAITLAGRRGRGPSASLSTEADGSVGLQLADGAGRIRARLVLDTDGEPVLELLDEDGDPIWSAP